MKLTLIRALALLPALLICLPAVAATSAGKVVYAFGQVEAESTDGRTRALKRGDRFGPGDTVRTHSGRAQLRFTDGGFAALQPNTDYKVEDYHYEGKADGNERSFLSLVRGSVRLLTGVIGRSNKSNFRLRTSVATIGIRGTSGKVSHCDANCGERGPGTALSGYGGVWDLNSGSYSGPVRPGQATFCNGSSCFDIPGFGQRSEASAEGDAEFEDTVTDNDEQEPLFQDGVQTDNTGRGCAVGGNCGADVLVATGLIGARASTIEFDSEELFDGTFGFAQAFDGLNVVNNDGIPVAGVVVGFESSLGEASTLGVAIAAIDLAAVRQAIVDIPNAAFSQFGLNILDQIPDDQLAKMNEMPATIGEGDFGRTSDGLLIHGRWQGGYVLDLFADLNGNNVSSSVKLLSGFQSDHWIFGADPGPMPTFGAARYDFTGGTFSTTTNGGSIGQGVVNGNLLFNFGTGQGLLQMAVRHAGNLFNVSGNLAISDRFFVDNFVSAVRGENIYAVDIDGFFAAPGTPVPQAAGLSYTIFTPVNLIGTAGFGLTADNVDAQAFAGQVIAAGSGSYVAFAHNFIDTFSFPNSNAFDFIVNGDTATTTDGVVTEFSSTTHPGLCTPACTFNANGAEPAEVGEKAELGISWARFTPGYSVAHADVQSPVGSAHVLDIEVPTALANIPNTGSGLTGTYNMLMGGTTPTLIFATGGTLQNEVPSPFTTADMTIDFNDGSISANFGGNVPGGGSWNLIESGFTGNGPPGSFVRTAGIHSLDLQGTVMSANVTDPGASNTSCAGGCSLFGHTHFDIAGVNATAVAGSIQANTSAGFEPAFLMSGTFVLQGTVTPGGM